MVEVMDVKPAQTTAPETEPTAWMTPDGEIRDGAPENIKSLLEKKKWTNISQFFDSYTELEKFKGIGEHLVIPEAEDVVGWENVYKQLGRPETFDKYDFTYEGDVEINIDSRQINTAFELNQNQYHSRSLLLHQFE